MGVDYIFLLAFLEYTRNARGTASDIKAEQTSNTRGFYDPLDEPSRGAPPCKVSNELNLKTSELNLRVIDRTLVIEGKHYGMGNYAVSNFIHRYSLPPQLDISDIIFKLEKSSPMKAIEILNSKRRNK